jgi:hypothetical protein
MQRAAQQARHESGQWLPPAWRAKGKTLLWWRAHLLAFIWRPLPYVLSHVESRRHHVNWPATFQADSAFVLPVSRDGGKEEGRGGAGGGGVLAVHVRRGDKA